MSLAAYGVALVAATSGLVGCSKAIELADDDASAMADGATGSDAGSTGDAVVPPRDSSGSPFPTDPSGRVLCGDEPCACDNGVDDDGDGESDGFDVECTGAFDDDEGSFATGIPGDNMDPAFEDCFFDGNSGTEDDGCQHHSNCIRCGDEDCGSGTPPQCMARDCCAVSEQCRDFCGARTPNGCDCFGCCTVMTPAGESVSIRLHPDCSIEDLSTCETCVPSADCTNACGRCELCLGRTAADLPEDCNDTPVCENGATGCSDSVPCGPSYYCHQGCCLVAPI